MPSNDTPPLTWFYAGSGSYAEAPEIDFCFHRKLNEIAGNPLMQNLTGVIYEFLLAHRARMTPSQRDNQCGRKLHREIVEAVRDREPEAAERAMRLRTPAVRERLRKPAAEQDEKKGGSGEFGFRSKRSGAAP